MSASYPGAIKSFTTKVNNVDTVDASHVNDLQLEVTAIETALGVSLANVMTKMKFYSISRAEGSGTGTVSLTGFGKTPKGVLCWGGNNSQAFYCQPGGAGGTSSGDKYYSPTGTSATWEAPTTGAINKLHSNGAEYFLIDWTPNSDGADISMTLSGSSSGQTSSAIVCLFG